MSGTGIVRDELFIKHDPGSWHPESPKRLETVYDVLDRSNWPDLVVLERRLASKEEITLVHTPDYYDQIARTDGQSVHLDADTQTSPDSFKAALAASGGMISLADQVLSGTLRNGFALVRPPGHHAETDRAMGFCLFNHAAVAAAWAIRYRGLNRVMIVDWDLHHGNGTQHAFYNSSKVLYLSTHQFPYYPGTGDLGEMGRGEGLGFNINIPLTWGHADAEFVSIFQNITIPAGRQYLPELILISAGFDAFHGDPLGDMGVTSEGFAALTRLMKQLAEEICEGRLIMTLEGGYHLDGLASAVDKSVGVLTGHGNAGEKLANMAFPEPEIVDRVRKIQRNYWKF